MYHAISPAAAGPARDVSPQSLPVANVGASCDFPGMNAPPPPLPPDSVYTSCYCEENIYLLAQAFTRLSNAQFTPDNRGPWPRTIYVVFISNGGKTVALWSQKTPDPSGVVVWDYHVVLVLLPRTPLEHRRVSDGTSTPGSNLQGPAERHAWVYDFDTSLPVPCPWIDYIAGTFPYARARSCVDEKFHSVFRVIPGDVYLDHFASDRSHMIAPAQATDLETQRPSGGASEARGRIGEAPQTAEEDPRYASPPPGYLPICGAKARAMGIVDNLMGSFVAMDALPAPHAEGSAACREDEDKCEDEGPWSIESEAVRYGQVMDMDAFLRWLPGSSDAGA